ncbi:hypothetical protein TorRG33x02_102300 [Trema orientale]|uniref:Uncharacterized protein n=1 Tax=Trema orientale TaxID=63057 RepID=A0A2P5F7Q8_TREOI|nr:hypothetical protein TorRG33x02_102300 [Trema orientale]
MLKEAAEKLESKKTLTQKLKSSNEDLARKITCLEDEAKLANAKILQLKENTSKREAIIQTLEVDKKRLAEVIDSLKEEAEDAYDKGMLKSRYLLYKAYKEGKDSEWEVDKMIQE